MLTISIIGVKEHLLFSKYDNLNMSSLILKTFEKK